VPVSIGSRRFDMNRTATRRTKLSEWHLSRQQSRDARRKLRATGDVDAAERLLRHSIAYGHEKLIIRRLFLVRALGLMDLREYEPFRRSAIEKLKVSELSSVLTDVQRFVNRLEAQGARPNTVIAPSEGAPRPGNSHKLCARARQPSA
jgi:hypothetical protein